MALSFLAFNSVIAPLMLVIPSEARNLGLASTTSTRSSIIHVRIQFCFRTLRGIGRGSNPFLLNISHHIHDPLIDPYKIPVRQRTLIHFLHVLKYASFPIWLVNRQTRVALEPSNLHRSPPPLA